MPTLLLLAILLSYVENVVGWTYTDYYLGAYTSDGTSYAARNALPIGPVTPTSTGTTTTLVDDFYPFTVTNLFLPPNASVCDIFCRPEPTTSGGDGIDTSYFAPVVISAPSSCTKTSVLYTTASRVALGSVGGQFAYPPANLLARQATESSVAVLVTTYVYTLSTNLGGQAVTRTRCDVYLNSEAVVDLTLAQSEETYLAECVDPRRYLCSTSSSRLGQGGRRTSTSSGACPITGGVYPPVSQTSNGGGASVGTASPTSRGGVGGFRGLASQGLRFLMVQLAALVLFVLL